MAHAVPKLAILALGLAAGCTREETDTGEVFVPDLPVETCGGPDHGWLPADGDLGRVVDWEYLSDLSMDAQTLAGILSTADIDFVAPVYDVRTYRIRYLTQDRGVLVETTGFVSLPDLPAGDSLEVPGLVWAHGTSGFTGECAPTALGFEGGAFPLGWASLGYAVTAPDYLGMNGWGDPAPFVHPYVVPEPTAIATLDALRALWRFESDTGQSVDVDIRPRTILFGASEGGFAALWADRYAAAYLPEAEIAGTVAMVPPTDVTGLAQHAVGTLGPTTEAFTAILATAHPWYGAAGDLADALTDEAPTSIASTLPGLLVSGCDDGGLFDAADDVSDLFVDPFVASVAEGDWDAIAPFGCYLQTATLRDTAIPRGHDAPVLFQVSEKDDLVVGSVERADFPRLCEAGYRAEYLECAGLDHVDGAVAALPYALDWIAARAAGTPLPEGVACVQGAPVDCTAL